MEAGSADLFFKSAAFNGNWHNKPQSYKTILRYVQIVNEM